MNRKTFLSIFGLLPLTFFGLDTILEKEKNPELLYFKDDGKIPNSKFPLLLYRNAIPEKSNNPSSWLKEKFASNNWTNSWRNGIYAFHHYHSTAHEVLGIYSGSVSVHLGGEKGQIVKVQAGDIIVIPAGVGHKKVNSKNLGVVGAYFNGRDWDLNRGEKGERPGADKNIKSLQTPNSDPFMGETGGLTKFWI